MVFVVRQQSDLKKQDLKKYNWISRKGSSDLEIDIKNSIDDAIDKVLESDI